MLRWLLVLLLFVSSLGGGENAMAASRSTKAGAIFLTSYYRINQSTKRFEACLLSPFTLAPLIIGCAPVAPPLEENIMPPALTQYIDNTRCIYLTQPRYDLKNLGSHLLAHEYSSSGSGNMRSIASGSFSPRYPVYDSLNIINFLKSDLHVVSTIVGCVQDMIVNIFTIPSAQQLARGDQRPFLGIVQDNMNSFVMATLSLYVALVGIKIMTSATSLKRGEYIMFLLKFVFVLYMNTTGMWAGRAGDNSSLNLFPALIYGSDYFMSMFTSALNTNDPVGACSYIYNGAEVLTEQMISLTGAGSSINTIPSVNGIHLTMWDLIDCKLATYISFSSCHYNGSGLLSLFMAGLSIVFLQYALFTIVLVAYIYLIITMALKFARITILCSIAIATLVIVSPLFSCFLLFEKTKSMFQDWVKAILGYMLYPAFIMAYFTLMILSIDSLYYGTLDLVNANATLASSSSVGSTRAAILESACKDVNNLFCATVATVGDPCANDVSNLISQFTTKVNLYSGVTATSIGSSVVLKYLIVVTKMMLFSLLFYLLMDSSIALMSMITGVVGLEKIAETGLVSFIFNALKSYFMKKMGG